jgi:hypothetical protein
MHGWQNYQCLGKPPPSQKQEHHPRNIPGIVVSNGYIRHTTRLGHSSTGFPRYGRILSPLQWKLHSSVECLSTATTLLPLLMGGTGHLAHDCRHCQLQSMYVRSGLVDVVLINDCDSNRSPGGQPTGAMPTNSYECQPSRCYYAF